MMRLQTDTNWRYSLNGNFVAIESEILDRLDKLFSQKKGDEISR